MGETVSRDFLGLFAFDTDDPDLAQAQFRSCAKQIPLLYLILIANAVAIIFVFARSDYLFRTVVTPSIVCILALIRAAWWWRHDGGKALPHAETVRLIRRTCNLSVVMTLAFDLWCMWIYPLGDVASKSHLTFFLGLTQVSSVFCLMSMRAAAMRVAVTSTLAFVAFFGWADGGQMLFEAMILACVGCGMMVVAHRYNLDFADLIRSQRDLRSRQIETERLSEENLRVSLTDSLTGLPNRRHLLAALDRLQARPDAAPDTRAVVFIDLDGFKAVNDVHGHQAGDALLSSLSARLLAICPPYAELARVGGDEFVVLVEAGDAGEKAVALGTQVRAEISQPLLVDRHVLQVGASIGIAGDAEGALNPHELLRRADTAMYHAKLERQGAIAVYHPMFDEGRSKRLVIEQQIIDGLARAEFDVAYQPVVDADTGAVVGAEALVRWPRRPEGPLHPEQFIGIAEATGQIRPLGLFVLERACADFKPLGDLKLSVNLSPAQFNDPGFDRSVLAVLEKTGFPPDRLQFEITENYLLESPARATSFINAFKSLGMSIALDDFGTGFTSIHYLQSYGFSHIKIDKSLLTGLHGGSKASLLITGTVFLANGLDMRVIAEGVETPEQATLLRAAGCHELQGFLFGRPMPIADFVTQCWFAAKKPEGHATASHAPLPWKPTPKFARVG